MLWETDRHAGTGKDSEQYRGGGAAQGRAGQNGAEQDGTAKGCADGRGSATTEDRC